MLTLEIGYRVLTNKEIDTILNQIDNKIKSLNKLKQDLYDLVYDKNRGLESLTGRYEITDMLSEIIYTFSKNSSLFEENFLNFAIYGNPGVGKSHLSKVISFVFSKCGLIAYDNIYSASSSDLISGHAGQTSKDTIGVLKNSLERVL